MTTAFFELTPVFRAIRGFTIKKLACQALSNPLRCRVGPIAARAENNSQRPVDLVATGPLDEMRNPCLK